MNLTRRVIVGGATAVALIAAATIGAVAAGGGFGEAPGQYSFSDTFAFVSTFNPTGGSQLNVNVDRGSFLYKPKGGGGFQRQPNMTVLSVDVESQPDPTQPPVPVANGCFILTPANSSFVVSTDLQAASLTATVNDSDSCFSPPVPVLGATPIKAAGGGGGGNFGFTYPLTVQVTWTGTGATSTSTDQGTQTCQTFHAITHTQNANAQSSSVAFSVSGFDFGGSQVFGSVNSTTETMQVTGSGIITQACGGPPPA